MKVVEQLAPPPQAKKESSMNIKHCLFIILELNKAAVVETLQRWQLRIPPISIYMSFCHVILPLCPTSREMDFPSPWIWAGLVRWMRQSDTGWAPSRGLKSPVSLPLQTWKAAAAKASSIGETPWEGDGNGDRASRQPAPTTTHKWDHLKRGSPGSASCGLGRTSTHAQPS